MKKILLTGLLVSTIFINVGCETEDIAIGLAGVAIGVGMANSYPPVYHNPPSYGHRPPPPPHHGHRPPPPSYGHRPPPIPHYGGHNGGRNDGRYDGRNDRRNDGRRAPVPRRPMDLKIVETIRTPSEVTQFSKRHNISIKAASQIKGAFDASQTKGMAAFTSIGLDQKDLKAIVNREMPKSKSLENVATKLDLSEAQARDLVKYMIVDFDSQVTNVGSTYWNACRARGQWKTPETQACTSLSQAGCSPATGASLCL